MRTVTSTTQALSTAAKGPWPNSAAIAAAAAAAAPGRAARISCLRSARIGVPWQKPVAKPAAEATGPRSTGLSIRVGRQPGRGEIGGDGGRVTVPCGVRSRNQDACPG